MRYQNIRKGIFKKRENRFIALIEIDGKIEKCHVKNTGRCKELLVFNVEVFVEENFSEKRKTRFSLISVIKNNKLINMDSQAPNKAVSEWIKSGGLFNGVNLLKSEVKFQNSRFDFYAEKDNSHIFIEVKGVTLEENKIVRFPDAPTKRGVKHIFELCDAVKQGYNSYIIFVIQMSDVLWFEPNYQTHSEFGEALKYAENQGVIILAYSCKVGSDFMEIDKKVKIKL